MDSVFVPKPYHLQAHIVKAGAACVLREACTAEPLGNLLARSAHRGAAWVISFGAKRVLPSRTTVEAPSL
jgi:hypothetical protein